MLSEEKIDIIGCDQAMVGYSQINLHHLAHHLELAQINERWLDHNRGYGYVGFKHTLNANRIAILDFCWCYRPRIPYGLARKEGLDGFRFACPKVEVLLITVMVVRRDPQLVIPFGKILLLQQSIGVLL